MKAKTDLEHLPSAKQISREIAEFKRDRLEPLAKAIVELERRRREIDRRIQELRKVMAELGVEPRAPGQPRAKAGRRKRATKAEMETETAALLERGAAVYKNLARQRNARAPAADLAVWIRAGFRPAQVVTVWNARNPDRKIVAEGKGRGRKYYVARTARE